MAKESTKVFYDGRYAFAGIAEDDLEQKELLTEYVIKAAILERDVVIDLMAEGETKETAFDKARDYAIRKLEGDYSIKLSWTAAGNIKCISDDNTVWFIEGNPCEL